MKREKTNDPQYTNIYNIYMGYTHTSYKLYVTRYVLKWSFTIYWRDITIVILKR